MTHPDLIANRAWYQAARFGLFIHWGLYAATDGRIEGRAYDECGEGICRAMDEADYRALARDFHARRFDADAWAQVAKRAGMRYLVITAKHYDGFALFRTGYGPNTVDDTPFGRDVVAELAAACRRHGLKLGIYHSQVSDYYDERILNADHERYLREKNLPQLRELLTNYGDVILLWFDGSPKKLDPAHRRLVYDTVKHYQPGCLSTNRLSHDQFEIRSMLDNQAPALPVAGTWEAPATMNDTWGFKADDHHWKSTEQLLHLLIDCASKGGNYLLNVGPDGEGAFPPESVERLSEIGAWMDRHHAAITDTAASPWTSEPEWGRITMRGAVLYAHVFSPAPAITLTGLHTPVRRVTLLSDGRTLTWQQDAIDGLDPAPPRLVIDVPEDIDGPVPVVAIELVDQPQIDDRLIQDAAGALRLPAHRGEVLHHPGAGWYPALTAAGMRAWWRDDRHRVRWTIWAHSPGRYRVRIHNTSPWHKDQGHPWQGGHRLRLSVGESSATGHIHGSEPGTTERWQYFFESIDELGIIDIPHAGQHELILAAEHIASEVGWGVGFSELRLVPE